MNTLTEKVLIEEMISLEWKSERLTLAKDRPILLTGLEGTGKAVAAEMLSKALLCELDKGDDECRSCKLFTSGGHPDLILFSADNIGIEELRDKLSQVYTSSFYPNGKVVLLPDAERLSNEAQQALLKTLEELPPNVSFIASASYPDRLLPTVYSRMLTVSCPALNPDAIKQTLQKKYDFSESDAQLTMMLTASRVRFALEIAKHGALWLTDMIEKFANMTSLTITDRLAYARALESQDLPLILVMYANYLKVRSLSGNAANAGEIQLLKETVEARADLFYGNKDLIMSSLLLGA